MAEELKMVPITMMQNLEAQKNEEESLRRRLENENQKMRTLLKCCRLAFRNYCEFISNDPAVTALIVQLDESGFVK